MKLLGKYVILKHTGNNVLADTNVYNVITIQEDNTIICKPIYGGRDVVKFEINVLYAADTSTDAKLISLRNLIIERNEYILRTNKKIARMGGDAIETLSTDFGMYND